jgi:hypothetical protein
MLLLLLLCYCYCCPMLPYLPVQVGQLHDVVIHQTERADARSSEVERGGRAEPAAPNDQDLWRVGVND